MCRRFRLGDFRHHPPSARRFVAAVGCVVALFCIHTSDAYGQTDSISNIIDLRSGAGVGIDDEWWSLFHDEDGDDEAFENLSEILSPLREQPIDLNRATTEDLARLPFLPQRLAEAIVEHRRRYGALRSPYELALVRGMDYRTMHLCLPFVTVGEEAPADTRRAPRLRQTLVTQGYRTLNRREGYRHQSASRLAANKAYRGDPWHTVLRYRLTVGHTLAAGFVIDKDAGERYGERWPWAGDAFYGHVAWTPRRGTVRHVIAGDYRVRLGCGLLVNQQFSLGKNLLSSSLMSQNTRVTPHTSTDEYHYFRGAATELRLGRHVRVVGFFSHRRMDGTLDGDTLTAIATDGLHRTEREEARRHTFRMSVGGLHGAWRNEWVEVGGNVVYSHLDKTYSRPRRSYNEHYFRGHELAQGSVEYRLSRFGGEMKGEVATDGDGGVAMLHAVQLPPLGAWSLLALYRHFSNRYRQLHASTFAEASDVQGERGLYLQASGSVLRHLDITASADYFHFTQAKYGIPAPSRGYEFSIRGDCPLRRTTCSLRYRLKKKEQRNTTGDDSHPLQGYYRHTLDAIIAWSAIPWLQLRGQGQCKLYSQQYTGSSVGYGFGQSIHLGRETSPIAAALQATWFHTDDYDSRLYLPERNLPYTFQMPMLYGEGTRAAALLVWRPYDSLTLEAKYTLTSYRHRATIGSDLQTVRGHSLHDLHLHLRWAF